MIRHRKILVRTLLSLFAIIFIIILITNSLAVLIATPCISHELDDAQDIDYILILGAGLNHDGSPGRMLRDRLNTALLLYHHLAKKGESPTLIVSGDRREGYDEVSAMRDYLYEQNIPKEVVLEDPTGFSTAESVANLKDIAKDGARTVLVTQEYHLYRALYIARMYGLDAYGLAAPPCEDQKQFIRDMREVAARTKDVLLSFITALDS